MRTIRYSLFTLLLVVMALALIAVAGAPASAQSPTPTPNPTEPPIEIGPANPTPTPKAPTLTPPPNAGGPKIDLPLTLEELLLRFPDLQPFVERAETLDIADSEQLAELYRQIVKLYNEGGAGAVATFLRDSGLLERLNIPLRYLDLLYAYDQGGPAAVEEAAAQLKLINGAREIIGRLAVDSDANANAVIEGVKALGSTPYKYFPDYGELEIGVPLDLLAQYQTPGSLLGYFALLGNLPHVEGFRGPLPSGSDGPTLQEVRGAISAVTIGADKWHERGITGKGVKVGVIDSGFSNIKAFIGKELPENLQANMDIDELSETEGDHGLGVALMVAAIAPEAEIYIGRYDDTATGYDAALEYLAENEVDIIAHSISFFIGPRDATGYISTMIARYADENDILWVNSAGNYATDHSYFEFNPGKKGVHQFSEDTDLMPFTTRKSFTSLFLTWNGNWEGREKNEYVITVYDEDGEEVASGAEPKRGKKNQLPFQEAFFESEPGATYYLRVQKTRGDDTNHMLDILIPGGSPAEWAQVAEYSICEPGDNPGVLTVAATGLNVDEIEYYSSRGPIKDESMKPDIAGPTGEDLPGFGRFFGTSGAAPLVAGAAALVKQEFPDLSASELKAWLKENVVDLGDEGEDIVFGAGRVALEQPENNDPQKPNKGKGSKSEASAEITDVRAKFNVRDRGVRGTNLFVSFELDNYRGKALSVLGIFFDEDMEPLEVQRGRFGVRISDTDVTVGVGRLFSVTADETVFEDFQLFIPNEALPRLKKGTKLNLVVVIFDASNVNAMQRLARSEPVEVVVK